MKRIVPILLVLLLLFACAPPAFASPDRPPAITGMAENLDYGFSGRSYLGEISPQEERVEYIFLTEDMFEWTGDYVPTASPLSPAQIRDARLAVRATGRNVLRSARVDETHSRIVIEFLDELVAVERIEFDFEVILFIGGQRQEDHGMTLHGSFANPVYIAYSGPAWVDDTSHGEVVEAEESIRELELQVGAGVTLATRMLEGDRVYATATLDPDEADQALLARYPSLREIVTLKTVGVPSSATVTLDKAYRDFYVYDARGEYLGRGNAVLPVSAKYYFSTGERDEPPDPETPEPYDDPGGSIPYPDNIHNIPATGWD